MCLFLSLYFEVFLLISFLEKKPHKKTLERPLHYPTVSILVPCWNKGKTLAATVHSLLALEYPREKLSIVIIDDGSTDNTLMAAQEFLGNPQVSIYSKRNEGSKYAALNYGIEHSSGELIGCLDADSFVAPDALIEVIKKFESNSAIMAVTPAMKVNNPRSLLERMQAAEYSFGIFYRKMFDNISAISVLPGPFSFYRREVFAKVGLFRQAHHTEDMEMAFRMHAHGLAISNAHTAIVSTNVPNTVGGLIRQRIRWSRGFLENCRDYSYMFLNPKFGNLGLFALPFGLAAYLAGMYSALFAIFHSLKTIATYAYNMVTTGVPLTFAMPEFEWFFVNTSMLSFLIIAIMGLTVVAILIGGRIVNTRIPFSSYLSYFVLFGLFAPLWLARATWDTLRTKETGWLV